MRREEQPATGSFALTKKIERFMGRGHAPLNEEVARGALYVRGEKHLLLMREILLKARESLVIETPWIRGDAGREFADALPGLLARGVRVRIFYGYSESDEKNDPALVARFAGLLREDLVRVPFGTHQKVLLVDESLAVVGSWNWLSNGHITRRRELSVLLRGDAARLIADEYREMEVLHGRKRA
jgi:phosphatidylserine/phosphatidylglycerophosphate/cardiolipin synthase-like enzyme